MSQEHPQSQVASQEKESRDKAASFIDEEDTSVLMRTEVRQGSRLGDVRVRLVRPSQQMFRRLDTGLLEATAATDTPRTPLEKVTTSVKRALIGSPLATAHMEHERLT